MDVGTASMPERNISTLKDPAKNESPSKNAFEIQTKTSTAKILVIPTNEELEIAEQTVVCIENGCEGGVCYLRYSGARIKF